MSKQVLDVCCGTKAMWYDKNDDRCLYLDKRNEEHHLEYPSGKYNEIIHPDIIGNFTDIKQPDESYHHVVFDPPHIPQKTPSGRITIKYGHLEDGWQEMIRKGFKECFRVLKPNGTLIFKWNECRIPLKEILALTNEKPLYGHKSGKTMKTHWVAFIKPIK